MSASPCPCGAPVDPQVVANPPGLPTIAYRVDDFAGFRRALLAPLADEVALLGWRPAPGDLGLQVLEWWAYLGDVLTFYNERIANESYLRTAQRPASVAGLVALLGYQPSPAVAAVGQVAAVRGSARPNEPLVIPAGMQLANTATPGVPVQTFEAAAASFSGACSVTVQLPPAPALLTPMSSTADAALVGSVLLAGTVSSLRRGDELLALSHQWSTAARGEPYWAKLTVVSTAPETDPNGGTNTRVVLDAAQLGEVRGWLAEAAAADVRLLRATQTAALWTQANDSGEVAIAAADGGALTIALASAVRAIAPADVVFLDGAAGTGVGLVTAVAEPFAAVPFPDPAGSAYAQSEGKPLPDIPVAHTVLTAAVPLASWVLEHLAPAAATVAVRFALKDVGTPIGTPRPSLTTLPATVTAPPGFTLPAGSPAFLQDATGVGIAVLASADGGGAVTLAPTSTGAMPATPASFALAAPLTLLAGLVDISRGTTVAAETLGTGDASIAGQAFTLARSPLTYLASAAGYASTLRIAVDGIYWSEAPTFYGQPPDATVFVVRQLPGAMFGVRFGDGINGARLPTGSQVVATYRYGAGVARPPAGRLTTILKPQPNLAAIANPVAVWGGADAQQPAEVKTDAPAGVLTFGRAISADDYETVAAQAAGVARACAYWTWNAARQRTLVKLYVGDDAGAVASASSALAGADDPNRPVAVALATAIPLTLACTLLIAPDRVPADVVAAATAAVADPAVGLFSPAGVGIGHPLYASQIEAALLVPGVRAVHGLTVTAPDGGDPFAAEPVGFTEPGEGAFYTLAAFIPSAEVDDG